MYRRLCNIWPEVKRTGLQGSPREMYLPTEDCILIKETVGVFLASVLLLLWAMGIFCYRSEINDGVQNGGGKESS